MFCAGGEIIRSLHSLTCWRKRRMMKLTLKYNRDVGTLHVDLESLGGAAMKKRCCGKCGLKRGLWFGFWETEVTAKTETKYTFSINRNHHYSKLTNIRRPPYLRRPPTRPSEIRLCPTATTGARKYCLSPTAVYEAVGDKVMSDDWQRSRRRLRISR
jgi:hypothetical protein